MGIETVCEGGMGGTNRVWVQIRNTFPGLGGIVDTDQDFVIAYRLQSDQDPQGSGECDLTQPSTLNTMREFFRHVLIKKFDDYFFRTDQYKYAHISRPIGFSNYGVLYEWVHGQENFPWDYKDENYRTIPVDMDELIVFMNVFNTVGISVGDDKVVPDGEVSKNFIKQEPPEIDLPHTKYTNLWKRIDLGPESLGIKWDKVKDYLEKNRDQMREVLEGDRYEMMVLITKFMGDTKNNVENFPKFDRLEKLVYDFRKSTAKHMGVQGISPLDEERDCTIQTLDVKDKSSPTVTHHNLVTKTEESVLKFEIRQCFPCIDGSIYTRQQIPTARICNKSDVSDDEGLLMFLRHFIIKKLENSFISQGRYSFPHITRPLGATGTAYMYEWAYGGKFCQKHLIHDPTPSNQSTGLDDWVEFNQSYREAGIDMMSKMSYVEAIRQGLVSGQIIVRQPDVAMKDNEYISRMWMRIGFNEDYTPIDYDVLENYLSLNEEKLKKNLTEGRFETMELALRFLKERLIGELSEDFPQLELIQGIHDYRVSALTHLDHIGFEPTPPGYQDLRFFGIADCKP